MVQARIESIILSQLQEALSNVQEYSEPAEESSAQLLTRIH